MEADFSHLLDTDIERAKKTLKQTILRLAKAEVSTDIFEEGLRSAHTLKALAAVKNETHLESYAAQLEQLFLKAQCLPPQEVFQKIQPALSTIEKELKQAYRIIETNEPVSKPSRQLQTLVDALHHMDQAQNEAQYQKHTQTLKADEVSVESLFRAYLPWVRQAAAGTEKSIQLDISVPVKLILPVSATQPIQTILVHLLRNAVYHGIEFPSVRQKFEKPSCGTIQLCAEMENEILILTVSDDGKGFCPNPDSTQAALQSLFSSHHSGSDSTATETSIYSVSNTQTGLGIGLHIVQSQIEKLDGELELKSIPGMGTAAICRIPFNRIRIWQDD